MHRDTSTNFADASERHGPSRAGFLEKTPIRIYLEQPSSFGQTWPWRSYVIYQYLFQVFLIAANLFVKMGDYSVKLLGLNFDTMFLLHPLVTYVTILLHMQAELTLKLWYPEDWPNRRQIATVLHTSVSAAVTTLFFCLNALVNFQRFWFAWWFFGWHFPLFIEIDHSIDRYYGSIENHIINALAWVAGVLIAYHIAALCTSLWANLRTRGDVGVEGAEVALEEQGRNTGN